MRSDSQMVIQLRFAAILAAAVLSGAAAAPTPYDAGIAAARSAMMAEPQKAFDQAEAALAATRALPAGAGRDLAAATADWLAGEALTRLKRPAEALSLLGSVLPVVRRDAPGSKLEGDVLRSRGRAASALGKIQAALTDFQSAFRIYQDIKDARSQAIALQEIGGIYLDARDYPHVIQYYAQSKEIFGQDPSLTLAAHNNLGVAYKEMGRFPQAEAEFRQALQAATELGSAYLEAHILTNVAFTEAQAGKRGAAQADAARGLALTARDPEAASEKPFLLGVEAKVAAAEGRYAQADDLLDQVFRGADLTATPPDYRDFHEVAAQVYERTGERALALEHLKAFKRLDDEGRALAASTNAALMSARFDFANQNLRISQLKAGQLERDIALARSRARLTAVITGGLLTGGGAALAVAILGFLSMRRSRNRIRAANEKLAVTNTALEKALKAKTEFLATTSHEIRTPLNGILGMAQVILADRALAPAMRERVQLMQGAGTTMRALVDDLLDMARIETGSITIERAPMALARVLAETLQFWTDQAAAKGVALRLDAEGLPGRVVADETRLRQVLFNLMSNALKFTDAGEIVVGGRYADGTLTLSVADTGIGIAPDKREMIFEVFAQADQGAARRYGGAGLGLAICKKICAAMGGAIRVDSAGGQGSTFTLSIPAEVAEVEEALPATDLASSGLVLVDANPLSRNILRALLEPRVRRIEATASLSEALEHLGVGAPDLVLADGTALKGEEGAIATNVHLLKGAIGAGRLAVLLAAADADQAPLLVAAGAAAVIVKPVTGPGLVGQLAAVFAPSADGQFASVQKSA